MIGRLYVSANAHRVRPFGVSKKELVDQLREFALGELGLKVPRRFLRRFTPAVLYSAMRQAQSGKKHNIFFVWENERDGVPF